MIATILLYTGITLTVIGWLALAWQGAKWMTTKKQIEQFPQEKERLTLRRNYCRFTILAGLMLLIIALII